MILYNYYASLWQYHFVPWRVQRQSKEVEWFLRVDWTIIAAWDHGIHATHLF